MPISTLDPRTALIVIDLQAGIVSLPLAHPSEDVVARAAELATAFRRHDLPVILVNVDGFPPGRTETARGIPAAPGWTDLVPGFGAQPSDHRITKRAPGAFTGTGLEPLLRSLGVTQVAVAGIATSAGVEMTARHAFELGFHVALAVDAMTDRDAEVHARSIAGIFRRIGETGRRPKSSRCWLRRGRSLDWPRAGRSVHSRSTPTGVGNRCSISGSHGLMASLLWDIVAFKPQD